MSYYGVSEAIDAMKGRKILSISLSENKERITFKFQDGHEQALGVEGDCCSHSWIEHLEVPKDLEGAEFLGHESIGSIDATEDDAYNPKREGASDYYPREHESLAVYQDVFRTSKGDVALEYRNSSNGYYGGYLVVLS